MDNGFFARRRESLHFQLLRVELSSGRFCCGSATSLNLGTAVQTMLRPRNSFTHIDPPIGLFLFIIDYVTRCHPRHIVDAGRDVRLTLGGRYSFKDPEREAQTACLSPVSTLLVSTRSDGTLLFITVRNPPWIPRLVRSKSDNLDISTRALSQSVKELLCHPIMKGHHRKQCTTMSTRLASSLPSPRQATLTSATSQHHDNNR